MNISSVANAAAPQTGTQAQDQPRVDEEIRQREIQEQEKRDAQKATKTQEATQLETRTQEFVQRSTGATSRLSIEARRETDDFIYRSVNTLTGETYRQWPTEAQLRLRDAQREFTNGGQSSAESGQVVNRTT
ncbi:MAG: hypothetical protein AAGC95_01970 [Pseudomonadota bacterium]